jgi:hypothetical protein
MQVQTFEGYWENGGFFPFNQPIRKQGRERAILTLLGEPAQDGGNDECRRQMEAMRLFMEENKCSDEPIPVFERATFREVAL